MKPSLIEYGAKPSPYCIRITEDLKPKVMQLYRLHSGKSGYLSVTAEVHLWLMKRGIVHLCHEPMIHFYTAEDMVEFKLRWL